MSKSMCEFKKGQVVYVSDNGEIWTVSHYVGYDWVSNSAYPFKANRNYQALLDDVADERASPYRYCLSVEDYHKMLKEPKDKDLVWAWDNSYNFAKSVGFYDAQGKKLLGVYNGSRTGKKYENYEVIPHEQWPQWAIDAYKDLQY